MNDPIELARELLRCPSVTPAEGGALSFLAGQLTAAGFTVERPVFSEPGTPDIENLYARIGTGAPHFMFAGHTDVVPPGPEAAWRHGPFDGTVENGVLYGRGAVDMKGGIACALAAALDYLAANGGKPQNSTGGSISFLITGDEESVAINGTIKLLQWAAARGEKFDHCVLGEPSNTEAVGDMIKVGRRGSQNGTLVITGKQGHVAYPERADNPVNSLAQIMVALKAQPVDGGTDNFGPSNLEFTSIDVGNKTVNLIPAEARARFNIRFNDLHTQETLRALIEARTKAVAGNARWHFEWDSSNADAFLAPAGPFVDTVVKAIHDVTGRTPKLSTTGGTSDARFIKNYCPVLEFGLVGQTMHAVDENTPVADLVTLTAVYRRILDSYFA